MSPSAAPPSPQEIHRKLSMHSATKPTNLKEKAGNISVSTTGNESDSDSIFTPDVLGLSPSGLVSAPPNASGSTILGAASSATAPHPLSSIAERRDGSGGEDSEDELDEGEGGWKTTTPTGNSVDESVIKTGYLWKKGERRKNWKKRWFVLRTAHLAYYKTAAEYQLLRLLELSDVHSCTKVALKRHENTFGLVSPVRTFYLQAKSSADVQEWVAAIEEARQNLLSSSTQGSTTNPIPIPGRSSSQLPPPPVTPSPPSHPSYAQNVTSSDSEDASPSQRTYSMSSQTRPVIPPSPSKSQTVAAPKDPAKAILSGYLMKCGSKRRNWRKRWFVLTGEKLVYSASHMDTKPHRQFPFSEILDALEYDLPKQHPPATSPGVTSNPDSFEPSDSNTFKIVTTKRTLLLCAPGEEDEIKWLGAIRALIARRSGAGVVPGDNIPGRLPATLPAASTTGSAAAAPNDVSPSSSGFSSSVGNSGIKGKVRRLSASGGTGSASLAGKMIPESAQTKEI